MYFSTFIQPLTPLSRGSSYSLPSSVPALHAKLQPYVFQLEFLYLAASCHGELFYKENIFGNLVTGNLADTEVAYIRFVQVCPLVPDNECADRFAVLLGRDAGYLHILDVSKT